MSMLTNIRKPSFTFYKRLVRTYVTRYRFAIIIAIIGMLMEASATAGNAFLMQPVLDEIFVNKDASLLTILPLAIMALALINAIGDYGSTMAIRYVGQRVVADMQGDLFLHLMRSDIGLFHDQSSGRLISRLTSDIMLMRNSVSQVFVGLIKETLTMIFLVSVMFYQNWRMALVAFGVLVFAVLPVIKLGRRMRKLAGITQARLADFTAHLDDTFQGVRVIKAYGREEYEAERARRTIYDLFRSYFRASRVQAASSPIMGMMGGFAIAAILWYGGFKVLQGDTTPGAFFAFITAMLMAYRPVKVIAGLNTQLQEGMAAAARFFAIIDTPPSIHDKTGATPLAIDKGEIAFNDVTFRYGEGMAGVNGLSFKVPAGRTVALVGASGAGKTTIMNLLLRFYDVQSGNITLDGQDIRDVTMNSLRGALAFVSQDVVLFNDTVRSNIAYGNLHATQEEIIAAAEKAHAHDFILQLPQGYDTPIGPQGVKLSGGQRQRLSIARAILKNAPILLLDEATSALDTASERAVQDALTELMQGRTTLVIAHRLSTIQHSDTILVLDGGRIRDKGTHEELLEKSAIYRELHQHPQVSAQ